MSVATATVFSLYVADPDGVTVEFVERPRDRRTVVLPEVEAGTDET